MPDHNQLDRIGIIPTLEDLLRIRVHVATEKGLRSKMRDAMLDDTRSL